MVFLSCGGGTTIAVVLFDFGGGGGSKETTITAVLFCLDGSDGRGGVNPSCDFCFLDVCWSLLDDLFVVGAAATLEH